MQRYVYKLKHKYVKHPELMHDYGFAAYKEDSDSADDSIEVVYAHPIALNKDGAIYKYLVGALEKIYEKATTEEREEDFFEYEFKKVVRVNKKGIPTDAWEVVITPILEKELTECQLCFVDKGLGCFTLFINAPDTVEYYSTVDLDENCGEIMNKLLEDGVVYKKKVHRK